jgi:hypothetical protein
VHKCTCTRILTHAHTTRKHGLKCKWTITRVHACLHAISLSCLSLTHSHTHTCNYTPTQTYLHVASTQQGAGDGDEEFTASAAAEPSALAFDTKMDDMAYLQAKMTPKWEVCSFSTPNPCVCSCVRKPVFYLACVLCHACDLPDVSSVCTCVSSMRSYARTAMHDVVNAEQGQTQKLG